MKLRIYQGRGVGRRPKPLQLAGIEGEVLLKALFVVAIHYELSGRSCNGLLGLGSDGNVRNHRRNFGLIGVEARSQLV